MRRTITRKPREEVAWGALLPESDWKLYRPVLEAAVARRLPFAIGGGLAFSTYAHRWRNTKDVDLYILPTDRAEFVELLSAGQFVDYYSQLPYDRGWIYRGYRDGAIIDLIWAMANRRAEADSRWLTEGMEISLRGLNLNIIPPEELIWAKLYVVQYDRCDWPDLLNVLYVKGPELNWEHLLDRVGDDARVLGGLLSLFAWLSPQCARELPGWVWKRVGLEQPAAASGVADERQRVSLLDTRDWFGPNSGGGMRSREQFAPAKSEKR